MWPTDTRVAEAERFSAAMRNALSIVVSMRERIGVGFVGLLVDSMRGNRLNGDCLGWALTGVSDAQH